MITLYVQDKNKIIWKRGKVHEKQSKCQKKAKWAGASCCAVGIVALSGLIASGAAVGAVVEGFKVAKETIGGCFKERR